MTNIAFQVMVAGIHGTQALAAAIAAQCKTGDCILLRGDLGAGKTAFVRAFIASLQSQAEEVVSPTFTLVQTYQVNGGTVWHFDLYRLRKPEEVLELGLEDALEQGLTLIEWPELVQAMLPQEALDIHIAYGTGEGARQITVTGQESAWSTRLAGLRESQYI